MSQPVYYQNVTLTTSYVYYDFGARTRHLLIIASDKINSDLIDVSFDGTNLDGEIDIGEPLNMPNRRIKGVWLKGASGSQKVRIWAY